MIKELIKLLSTLLIPVVAIYIGFFYNNLDEPFKVINSDKVEITIIESPIIPLDKVVIKNSTDKNMCIKFYQPSMTMKNFPTECLSPGEERMIRLDISNTIYVYEKGTIVTFGDIYQLNY